MIFVSSQYFWAIALIFLWSAVALHHRSVLKLRLDKLLVSR
jgi:hypothetical protein